MSSTDLDQFWLDRRPLDEHLARAKERGLRRVRLRAAAAAAVVVLAAGALLAGDPDAESTRIATAPAAPDIADGPAVEGANAEAPLTPVTSPRPTTDPEARESGVVPPSPVAERPSPTTPTPTTTTAPTSPRRTTPLVSDVAGDSGCTGVSGSAFDLTAVDVLLRDDGKVDVVIDVAGAGTGETPTDRTLRGTFVAGGTIFRVAASFRATGGDPVIAGSAGSESFPVVGEVSAGGTRVRITTALTEMDAAARRSGGAGISHGTQLRSLRGAALGAPAGAAASACEADTAEQPGATHQLGR